MLTLPHRLRYALAWDHELCRAVLGVSIRALLTFERRPAERRGFRGARGGAVTAIQRFGSALNLNVAELAAEYHIAERCIDHVVGSVAAQTYDRWAYLEEKRDAFERWASSLRRILRKR